MSNSIVIVPLCDLEANQEADFFALLAHKEVLKTKEGKPYLKVSFRDAMREVRFPIWQDVPIYKEFRELKTGMFCKLRAVYRETTFGPQLDIRRIREVMKDDAKDGFDPLLLRPRSPFPLDGMLEELQNIVSKHIKKGFLHSLITKILKEHRTSILTCVAARVHHHPYVGGLLEHTLSVTKIAISLIDHYHTMYSTRKGEISRPLVVAGAILHDIGKILEYEPEIGSTYHSVRGELLGHAVLGRDLVHDAAKDLDFEPSELTHLEHIILSHQRFPDWGAAKPPMSLEAMIVHHADSCDAILGCFWNTFSQDHQETQMTTKNNVIGYPLLKPPH
ncbi:MAG: 3'-5' exoribonuclease YhaM family protein [Thermoguttaceae bacterium]